MHHAIKNLKILAEFTDVELFDGLSDIFFEFGYSLWFISLKIKKWHVVYNKVQNRLLKLLNVLKFKFYILNQNNTFDIASNSFI